MDKSSNIANHAEDIICASMGELRQLVNNVAVMEFASMEDIKHIVKYVEEEVFVKIERQIEM